MHLLLIHQAFGHPFRKGGTRHYEFARYMAEYGHKLSAVTSDVDSSSNERVTEKTRLFSKEEIDGVSVYRAYTLSTVNSNFILRIFSFLSFAVTSVLASLKVPDVDVVMGTSPQIFQAFSAWVVATLRRKPFLLEVRDLWPDFAIDMGVLKNPFLIWLARQLESFLYARALHIVVNSPAYRDYMINRGIRPEKVTLVANGVDPSTFFPEETAPQIREELNLNGKFIATYAGALGMANDISTILQAADKLRDEGNIRFLILGDGKERKALEAEAETRGLNNVLFAGSCPKCDLPLYLATSDVCLATLMDIKMFETTYPNKVFDYMAAGRPTILGIGGVIRKVVEDAKGGIFVGPGNPDKLAQAVRDLFNDPGRCQAMGRDARKHVEEHFNRKKQAGQFLELVKELGK